MSTLSVRIPRDLEKAMPPKQRSAWVVAALREQIRQERLRAIIESAAAHKEEDLASLAEWENATAPLPRYRKARKRR